MKRAFFLPPVLGCVALLLVPVPAHAASALEIRDTPDGKPNSTVLIDIPRGGTATSRTVFLASADPGPLSMTTSLSTADARITRPAADQVVTLPGGGKAVPLQISVDNVILPGTRTGSLLFSAGGTAVGSIEVKITKAASPSLVIERISPATGTMPWGFQPATVDLHLQLHETSGYPVTLSRPELLSLVNDTDGAQTRYASLDVVGGADDLVVQGGQRQEVVVRVTEVASPAKYSAQLGVVTNAGDDVVVPISFTVARPWWLAALLIALGVALSGFVRYFVISKQTLTQQLQLQLLTEDPDALLDQFEPLRDSEKGVVGVVRSQVGDLSRKMAAGILPKNEQLDGAAAKIRVLPRYLAAHRKSKDAGTHPAELETVETYLRTPLDDAKLASLCSEANAALDEGSRKFVAARIEAINLEPGATPAAAETHTEAARKAADKGNFVRAQNELEAAHRVVAGDKLKHLVEAGPPVGVNEVDWQALQERTMSALEDDGLRDATRDYLTLVTAGLRKDVTGKIAARPADAAVAAAFEPVLASLTEAQIALAGDDIAKATEQYDRAKTAYSTAVAGADTQAANGKTAAVAGAPTAPPPPPPPIPPTLGLTWPAKKIRRRQRAMGVVVTLMLAVVAVLLGLQILYLPEPAWGTPGQLLIAVLWGLGLHPVGGAVFGGLQGLRDRFTGTTSPPGPTGAQT
ncbi:hypothetical protein AB0J40_20850 [Amycolatopsis sp. NPDC049691]|uniref:hypothetical protein n=1 Tax=Amycolatopsis sp. NPDC049691 TaxID=3155155 RepID=UPI003428F6DF